MARFNEVVDEVIALCGNRRDNRALFESAVNQAILALWNKHVGYSVGTRVENIYDTDPRVSISPAGLVTVFLGQDYESVEGVSYERQDGSLVQIQKVAPNELLELSSRRAQYPTAWTVTETAGLYLLPLLNAVPTRLVVLGVVKPRYLSGNDEVWMLPDSMRASYVALATAIAKTYLGEAEMAQPLGLLSSMLGAREIGPSGKVGVASAIGVRPLIDGGE